jgi:hypothetical protein
MNPVAGFIIITAILISCNTENKKQDSGVSSVSIEGTWKLVSGATITKNDTVFTDYTKNQEMIKVINATHFAFLKHGLNNGKDSAVYDSGGGSYTLANDQYTEHLQYCSEREWEGHDFQFTVAVKNDTLVQQGIEKVEGAGIDRVIIEKYAKLKN